VASVPVMLHYGRRQWFFLDEWSFLVNRSLAHPHTLFEPHNGHWVTVPAIVYRVLFSIWGLNTYRPYQLGSILTHAAVVLLVWCVMRRLGVRPWIATFAAAALVFYGSGSGNILFGFQITLTGAVACGLVQLLLADHDGGIDRRDVIGLIVGFVGLMCSGVAVAMVAMVGVAALLRRGWRAAAFHAGPLAVAYLVWYVRFPSNTARDYSFGFGTLQFVGEMGRSVFVDLGQNRVVAAALIALAFVGLGWAVYQARLDHSLRPLALPLALVAGFLAFAWVTAVARVSVGGVTSAGSDRYVDVATALLLPLIALGIEVLGRRQILIAAASLVLLAVGVPGNINLLANTSPYTRGQPDYVKAAAHSPLLSQLPADMRIRITDFAPELAPTAGWLRQETAAGRIPRPSHPTPQVLLLTDLLLAVRPAADGQRACPASSAPRRLLVKRGDQLNYSGAILVHAISGTARSTGIPFNNQLGRLDVVAGPIQLLITGVRGQPPRIC